MRLQWRRMKSFAIVLFLAACGGGGSDPNKDAAVDSPHATVDAHGDALGVDAPAGPTLRVKNYLAWCSVTVAGHPASSAAVQDVPVTAGTINVSAVALSGFQLGTKPWHDTAGDTTGMGEQGTVTGTGQSASSATTVVVGASGKCVWVCCEFTGGGGCPTADQCP